MEEEKKAKEHQIVQLNEDLAAQDEAIAKLSKEKAALHEEHNVSIYIYIYILVKNVNLVVVISKKIKLTCK